MTYEEIQAEISKLAFNPPATNAVALPVPFIIPQAIFANDMELIKAYAIKRGYRYKLTREIEIIEDALDPNGKPYKHTRYEVEEYDNPQSELQWLCNDVRDKLREDFIKAFAQIKAEQAAKEATNLFS